MRTTLSKNSAHVNEPPHTNRGVGTSHLQDCVFSVDWVRLTVWVNHEQIKPMLSLLGVDVGLEYSGHGGLGFQQVHVGQNGFQLYTNPVNEAQVFVSLNLPSKSLQAVGLDRFVRAYEWLCEQGLSGVKWSCTRLDLAFDTQRFSVGQVVDAWDTGLVTTAATESNEIKGKPKRKRDKFGDLIAVPAEILKKLGHTFYIGSRQSLAMLRVYNKLDGVSFGTEYFTRVELELKKERAMATLLEIMAGAAADMAAVAARYINGFLQIEATWWNEFIGTAERAWTKIKQAVPTVESVGVWLRKQVAVSLSMYIHAVSQGEIDSVQDEINSLLADGRLRFSKKHRELINAFDPSKEIKFAVYSV